MLKKMIEGESQKTIKQSYPHIEHPSSMYAKITKVTQNVYNLRILDENKTIDTSYPEIPFVKSNEVYKVDDIVVVTLLYGKLSKIYIIGKVV